MCSIFYFDSNFVFYPQSLFKISFKSVFLISGLVNVDQMVWVQII